MIKDGIIVMNERCYTFLNDIQKPRLQLAFTLLPPSPTIFGRIPPPSDIRN